MTTAHPRLGEVHADVFKKLKTDTNTPNKKHTGKRADNLPRKHRVEMTDAKRIELDHALNEPGSKHMSDFETLLDMAANATRKYILQAGCIIHDGWVHKTDAFRERYAATYTPNLQKDTMTVTIHNKDSGESTSLADHLNGGGAPAYANPLAVQSGAVSKQTPTVLKPAETPAIGVKTEHATLAERLFTMSKEDRNRVLDMVDVLNGAAPIADIVNLDIGYRNRDGGNWVTIAVDKPSAT